MVLSSGDVKEPYVIIGMITAMGSDRFAEKAYKKAIKALEAQAEKAGADAVLFVRFEINIGHKGCFSSEPPWEAFAWGTAVRFVSEG